MISSSGVRTLHIRWVSVCACADVKWGFLHLPFISTRTLQQSHTAFTTTFQPTTLDNETKQGCMTVLLNEEDNLRTATSSRTKAATILIIKHGTTSSSSLTHTPIKPGARASRRSKSMGDSSLPAHPPIPPQRRDLQEAERRSRER